MLTLKKLMKLLKPKKKLQLNLPLKKRLLSQ
jgi:hypothetical protein